MRIDAVKDKHNCFIKNSDDEVHFRSPSITNNISGFIELYQGILSVTNDVDKVKVELETTGHDSYNLLRFLLNKDFLTYTSIHYILICTEKSKPQTIQNG